MLKVVWFLEDEEGEKISPVPMEKMLAVVPQIAETEGKEFASPRDAKGAVWGSLENWEGPPESCPDEILEEWQEEVVALYFALVDSATGEEIEVVPFASD